ncbi:MAG: hypothetical protein GX850_01655 [Clostridiaceae bacterium]|jgi:uncharacterized membrane protein|nr:hypothetical protein [Clostridiaceae bacterium]
MEMNQLMMGLIRFLHDFFTVVWVGGLAFMVFTLAPSLSNVFGKDKQAQDVMQAVTRKHRVWVYISIVGLLVTGLLLGKSSPGFSGLMRFDNLYSTLASIKHLLTFAMIGVALFRSISFAKKDKVLNPKQNKISFLLIAVNLFFGVIVLLLSALMAVLR